MARRTARVLVAALMALPLAACGSAEDTGGGPAATVTSSDKDGYQGIRPPTPYAVPAVELTDTEGRPFDLSKQSRRTLVFFGYTNCPDICQVVMSTVASAMTRLSDSERDQLQVAFVTTDPARDTPAALRTYLDRFHPDFVGATGSLDQINALGKPMGIDVEKGKKLPSGGYEVNHTTVVVSVRQAEGDLVWTAATSPADMAEDLRKILEADA